MTVAIHSSCKTLGETTTMAGFSDSKGKGGRDAARSLVNVFDTEHGESYVGSGSYGGDIDK